MDTIEKAEEARDPFAVATAQAKEEGHTDFSEGSAGKKRRGEIAEAIKRDVSKSRMGDALVGIYHSLSKLIEN